MNKVGISVALCALIGLAATPSFGGFIRRATEFVSDHRVA